MSLWVQQSYLQLSLVAAFMGKWLAVQESTIDELQIKSHQQTLTTHLRNRVDKARSFLNWAPQYKMRKTSHLNANTCAVNGNLTVDKKGTFISLCFPSNSPFIPESNGNWRKSQKALFVISTKAVFFLLIQSFKIPFCMRPLQVMFLLGKELTHLNFDTTLDANYDI